MIGFWSGGFLTALGGAVGGVIAGVGAAMLTEGHSERDVIGGGLVGASIAGGLSASVAAKQAAVAQQQQDQGQLSQGGQGV